jgi:uncharacterized protein DUF2764
MNKYYYLVASLPYLRFTKEAPLSGEKFLYECEKWLTSGEVELVKSLTLRGVEPASEDVESLKEWKIFNKDLLKNLAEAREDRTSQKEEEVVRNIMDEENALLMEKRFERTRWKFLESIEVKYFFDFNIVVLYCLKLQILERLFTFNKDKGEEVFYNLCEVKYE